MVCGDEGAPASEPSFDNEQVQGNRLLGSIVRRYGSRSHTSKMSRL
jgi:hypothetical protein